MKKDLHKLLKKLFPAPKSVKNPLDVGLIDIILGCNQGKSRTKQSIDLEFLARAIAEHEMLEKKMAVVHDKIKAVDDFMKQEAQKQFTLISSEEEWGVYAVKSFRWEHLKSVACIGVKRADRYRDMYN